MMNKQETTTGIVNSIMYITEMVYLENRASKINVKLHCDFENCISDFYQPYKMHMVACGIIERKRVLFYVR